MTITAADVIQSEGADARLAQLSLRQSELTPAVQLGLAAAVGCTRHDPLNLPGLLQWGRTIRGLRDALVPHGWTSENDQNFPTVVNPEGTLAISVAGGDYYTGRSDGTPSTRSKKGPVTRAAVQQNQLCFAIVGGELVTAPLPDSTPLPRSTWLLLHYHDREAAEMRMELSLPAGLDDEDIVTAWHERILLAPLNTAYEPPLDEGTDIDVPIARR